MKAVTEEFLKSLPAFHYSRLNVGITVNPLGLGGKLATIKKKETPRFIICVYPCASVVNYNPQMRFDSA